MKTGNMVFLLHKKDGVKVLNDYKGIAIEPTE